MRPWRSKIQGSSGDQGFTEDPEIKDLRRTGDQGFTEDRRSRINGGPGDQGFTEDPEIKDLRRTWIKIEDLRRTP